MIQVNWSLSCWPSGLTNALDKVLIGKIVDGLFPEGACFVDPPDEVAPEERYWVIPGKHGPRWLIPQDARYSCLIFKNWCPYDLISLAKWKVLHGLCRVGELGRVPGIISVGIVGSARQQWEHLGWCGDSVPFPFVYIGTPGPTQKAVLSLFDSHSKNMILVAKAPLGGRASDNILYEYDVLSDLETEDLVLAPRPLFVDRERGLAVQEGIVGEMLGSKFSHAHIAYLNKLSRKNDMAMIRTGADSLARRFEKLNSTDKILVQYVEKLLDDLKDTTEIPVVKIHGDFKPWNILRNRTGGIVAIDWEFSEPQQIMGLDVIHYFYDKNISKQKRGFRQLENILQNMFFESAKMKLDYRLFELLRKYHSLWYAVMLCENGYGVSGHVHI